MKLFLDPLKTIYIVFFLFSTDFFYIYIYYRKFNAEFNKLIKTEGHLARFSKNDVEHTRSVSFVH